MSINCEILDLRAFQAVVELESFHRAAEALHISQPALTGAFRSWSRRSVPLAGAHHTPCRANAMGQEVMPLVRRMLEEFDGSLFAMRDGALRRGLITMACVPTAAFYFLPTVIKTFSEQYPHIRLRIRDLTANEGLQAVARGEVEFGINLMGNSDPDLSFEPLIDDPFVLAMRKDHPLAKYDTIHWNQLEPYPLVVLIAPAATEPCWMGRWHDTISSSTGSMRSHTSTRHWDWSRQGSASLCCRARRPHRKTIPIWSPARLSIRWSRVPSGSCKEEAVRSRPQRRNLWRCSSRPGKHHEARGRLNCQGSRDPFVI